MVTADLSGKIAVVIGVDLGTSACKAGAFTLDGEQLGEGRATVTVERPSPGWAEQDPALYWESTVASIRQAIARIDAGAVVGIGCAGHTPTLVLVDAAGRAVRPAIVWQDSRAAAEAAELEAEVPAEQWRAWLGMDLPRNASYPPARLRWLHRHEPESLARTHRILQPKDYVNYWLTGVMASDFWDSKGLVHLQTGRPVEIYRQLLGIDPSLAPPCRRPDALLGGLTATAAEALRLPADVPVATGWSDAMAGMLGTGALAGPGCAFDLAGTSEIVGLTVTPPPTEAPGVLVAPSLDPELAIVYGPTQASGGALEWFDRTFPGEQNGGHDELPDSAAGLLFLPYLEGERAPLWDASARAVFSGIQSFHRRGHFRRAVLEGVAFSIRHVLDTAEAAAGIRAEEVRLSGGGGRDEVWNQIRADVLGRPLQEARVREAGTLGAAMLAAMAAGRFDGTAAASEAMVGIGRRFEPSPARAAGYEEAYRRYRFVSDRVARTPV